MTLNTLGNIVVSQSGYLQGGELFNLIDWVNITTGGFKATDVDITVGLDGRTRAGGESLTGTDYVDLDLPSLGAGLFWDTTYFNNYGVVIVVPEPSRVMLLFFGLFGLFFRRRRNGNV